MALIRIKKGSELPLVEDLNKATFLAYEDVAGLLVTKRIDLKNMTPLFGVSSAKGQSETQAISQKRFTNEIAEHGVKFQYGVNRLNPNYAAGMNKGLNAAGEIINNTGWYVSQPIRWDGVVELLCQRHRLSCQYDEFGNFVAGSFNNPSSGNTELNYKVSQINNSSYIRVQLPMSNRLFSMVVVGNVMPSPYVPYKQMGIANVGDDEAVFRSEISIEEKLQQYVLAETYRLTSTPIYTDGLLNSPISVQYPDGGVGTIVFTRNSDGFITVVVAEHIGENKRMSMTLGRNTDGSIFSQSIVFTNIT